MKKYLIALLLGAVCLSFVACDTGSSSSEETYKHEKYIKVTGKSHDVIEGLPGDIFQFNGEGWRVIVTTGTKIYVQRPSCSGLNSGVAEDIKIGYTIFFKYDPEQVDYMGSPDVVRAEVIEAYRPECVGSSPNSSIEIVTNTVVRTNTTTTTETTVRTNIVRRQYE